VGAFPEKAALVIFDPDRREPTFDPMAGVVDFPGGSKKFTIRFDPESRAYWTLATATPPKFQDGKPSTIRNTLALLKSSDLHSWEWRATLLQHPDIKAHAFQYPDWQFEGGDIIAVVRTAWDDSFGGAHNAHDANFLTFHRFANFRTTRD
jgi:hypothetical protein